MADDIASAGKPELGVTITGLDGVLAKADVSAEGRAILYSMITKMTLAIRALAMQKIRQRSRATMRSIQSDSDPVLLEGHVGAISKVGLFLEKGTGIYGPLGRRIVPKSASVMRWPGGATALSGRALAGGSGNFIFARSTKGMKAHPWLLPAFEEAQATAFPILMDQAGIAIARTYLEEIKASFQSGI